MRGESDTGTFGDWGAAENFTLPSVPHPQNITASLFTAKRESERRISLEVNLEWKAPDDLKEATEPIAVRERRQAEPSSDNDITGYEVLISTEESAGTDYAPTPTGAGLFSQRFQVRIL